MPIRRVDALDGIVADPRDLEYRIAGRAPPVGEVVKLAHYRRRERATSAVGLVTCPTMKQLEQCLDGVLVLGTGRPETIEPIQRLLVELDPKHGLGVGWSETIPE